MAGVLSLKPDMWLMAATFFRKTTVEGSCVLRSLQCSLLRVCRQQELLDIIFSRYSNYSPTIATASATTMISSFTTMLIMTYGRILGMMKMLHSQQCTRALREHLLLYCNRHLTGVEALDHRSGKILLGRHAQPKA